MKDVILKLIMASMCLLLGLMSFADERNATAAKSNEMDANSNVQVTVYYFHNNFRCKTCRAIEETAKKSVEEGFAEELKQGRVIWKTINTDEPEHKHFVKDFELITKSLIVVREEKGQEPTWKNCPKIWELVWKTDAFKKYVIEQVRASLAGN